MQDDLLTQRIIGCAIEVHRALGPGTALHHAQLLTYMKVSQAKIGLLINFNVTRLAEGIKRFRL